MGVVKKVLSSFISSLNSPNLLYHTLAPASAPVPPPYRPRPQSHTNPIMVASNNINDQLAQLRAEARSNYRQRKLKMAANKAQIALDFGRREGADVLALVRLHLLLAKIYRTNGRYQSEAGFFERAHEEVNRARSLNEEIANPVSAVYVDLVCGSINHLQSKLDEAEKCFHAAFAASQRAEYTKGIIEALLGLSQISLQRGPIEEARRYADDAKQFLDRSDQSENTALSVKVLRQLAECSLRVSDHGAALRYSQQSLELSRRLEDSEQEVLSLKNIAVVSAARSNYKIGMQYFLQALERAEQLGYRPEVSRILINIGTIYAHLFNYADALQRYQRVLNEYNDVLDVHTRIVLHNNLGLIYGRTEEPGKAQRKFERALSLARTADYPGLAAMAHAQLGRLALREERYDEARVHARAAAMIYERLPDAAGLQINYLNLGELSRHADDLDTAERYIDLGIRASRELEDETNEQRGLQLMSNLLRDRHDYRRALEYQERHSRLQEEFNRIQRNRQFLDLEIRHAIREQKQQIAQLTRENQYQAQLLRQSDQIGRQNDELRRANEDLRQFAYIASHDLKEPLRMIGSYTQLIERMYGSEEGSADYFGYVREGVTRMNRLLDALLRYATIGNTEIERDVVDLNLIVEICMFNLKVRIEETGASVSSEPLPTVRGEQSLLIQLFQNLISNALKFMPEDRTPVVSITAEEVEGFYRLHLTDNGIGIAPEYQDRIFEIFQRLHARSKFEGTGIGLAICQRIVEKHGGEIWLTSSPGEGTTFSFSIEK